jgi:hypothetical protein
VWDVLIPPNLVLNIKALKHHAKDSLGLAKNVGVLPQQLQIVLIKSVQMMMSQLQMLPVNHHCQDVSLRELGVLKKLLPVDPIKALKISVNYSKVTELNSVGMFPLPPLLLLVLKNPVVITPHLLQIQNVKTFCPQLKELLLLYALLMDKDVSTILETVHSSLEPSNNVAILQL